MMRALALGILLFMVVGCGSMEHRTVHEVDWTPATGVETSVEDDGWHHHYHYDHHHQHHWSESPTKVEASQREALAESSVMDRYASDVVEHHHHSHQHFHHDIGKTAAPLASSKVHSGEMLALAKKSEMEQEQLTASSNYAGKVPPIPVHHHHHHHNHTHHHRD